MKRAVATAPSPYPLFVFLEGAAGVGKSSLAKCMSQRGYAVHFENFVELSQQFPQYDAGAIVMSFKWAALMIERLESLSREYAASVAADGTPATPAQASKRQIMFFDRSLLTPFVFTRANRSTHIYPELMAEIKQSYNCNVVLCKTDVATVQQRLLDRYNRSSPAEQEIRRNLGETNPEFIRSITAKYLELEMLGHFELSFDTSRGTVDELADELLQRVQNRQ